MKHGILYTSILTALLTACGGGSGSGSSDISNFPKEDQNQQLVTSDNVSEAFGISNASAVNVDSDIIPPSLPAVESSNVDSVVVTANSNFKAILSVPAESIPSVKKVAGYLIETSPDNFVFVPASSSTIQAASMSKNLASGEQVTSALPKREKIANSGFKAPKVAIAKNVSILASASVEGETEINFAGWSSSEFTLESSIQNLKLRIYPLLVNKTVSNVSSIEDIDLEDSSNWVGIQELLLNVEAVATATIQVSLTWDSQTDIDLWVVDKDGSKLYWADSSSPKFLGWLDFDNVYAYGPENMTFDYQMPAGDYKIYVHHFDGGVETNYQVTIAVGDDVKTIGGYFPEGVTSSSEIDDQGVHYIDTITVDGDLNSQLKTPVLLSQYTGVWKLPENSSAEGYFDIKENSITAYYSYGENECEGYTGYEGTYFPTGFSVVDNQLKVSDAMLGADYPIGDYYGDVPSFSYSQLDLELSTLPSNCTLYIEDDY